MRRNDFHITPAPNGWKALLEDNMMIMTRTKKELVRIICNRARKESPCFVFIHKADGSVQQVKYFR